VTSFLIRRLLIAVFVVIGVSAGVFLLTFLSGDPAVLMLPPEATTQQVADFRQAHGLNDPLAVQYVRFATNALHGDFGTSLRHGRPTMDMVMERLPVTLRLSVFATVLALAVAIPLGVLAAVHRGSLVDLAAVFTAVFGQSIPNFWLGIMLIYLVAVQMHLLPTSGGPGLSFMILPGVVIAANLTAMFTRIVRSSMLEVLTEDYLRTARSKGLTEAMVLSRHAFRNAAIPLVTLAGLQFGYILGGAVVIETVFMWPGLGLLTVQAITNRDYPLVQAAVFVLAVSTVVVNLATDVLYAYLDPRVKLA